jgi:DNA-binding transcriptional regulator YiaG
MENDKIQLAKRFLALRQKLGLTQQEISELFNVHYTTWQSWEYGTTKPVSKHIRFLEKFEKNPPKVDNISDMCRIIRNKLRYKKYQMADIFSVDPHTWTFWERGEMKPSNEFIEKIKQMYDELIEKEQLQKAS